MEAIKKKMQAMKLEKDNAMDSADACELKVTIQGVILKIKFWKNQ